MFISLLPKSEYKSRWKYYYYYWWRFEQCGYTLSVDRKSIRIFNDRFTIAGESPNTIWTSFGILCEHEYDFFDDKDYLMIDIGLNIGVAALWFAAKDNIRKVYGYEPFSQTFRQAAANLDNNFRFKDKIKIFNFGLGKTDKVVSIHYNPVLPGSMSTVKDLYPDIKKTPEQVLIRPASAVLQPVFEQNTGLKKFVKIDCEGSELEILENLSESGLLTAIDLIILEWHFGNVQQVVEILKRNGFMVTCRHTVPDFQGNIVAVSMLRRT